MLQEKVVKGWSGWVMVGVLLAALAGSIVMLASSSDVQETAWLIAAVVAVLALDGLGWFGFTVVPPNTARVVLLFGNYLGSIKTPGFWWVNPLTTRRLVSLKVRNFESGKLKVNDHIGNPIEIAAIVVWRVVETAEAVFQVDDYEHFVHVQTESAVRNLATSFPYDAHEEGELSLRGSAAEVSHAAAAGDPGSTGHGGRGGDRSAHQPPRVRAGDCQRDAAPPAGDRDHRRATEDRRGRRRHGRNGARAAEQQSTSSSSTRSARPPW